MRGPGLNLGSNASDWLRQRSSYAARRPMNLRQRSSKVGSSGHSK
jgi:hypothetical protein